MRRRILIAVAAAGLLVAAGVLLTWVMTGRALQHREYCTNNLRELSQFALAYSTAEAKREPLPPIQVIPAGTVVNPALPVEQRLSWVPAFLPLLDQRRLPTDELSRAIDPTRAWDAGPNREAATARLPTLLCPAAPPEVPPGGPGVTQYVGNGGLGAEAAVPLGPPVPPQAGAFRFDAPTPLAEVSRHDGLSHTLLFLETNAGLGPWLRGGPATVRGLDDRPEARPLIGVGGQFGGTHANGANAAVCDGSVRFLTLRIDPAVLKAMTTIAGGKADPTPGEL